MGRKTDQQGRRRQASNIADQHICTTVRMEFSLATGQQRHALSPLMKLRQLGKKKNFFSQRDPKGKIWEKIHTPVRTGTPYPFPPLCFVSRGKRGGLIFSFSSSSSWAPMRELLGTTSLTQIRGGAGRLCLGKTTKERTQGRAKAKTVGDARAD